MARLHARLFVVWFYTRIVAHLVTCLFQGTVAHFSFGATIFIYAGIPFWMGNSCVVSSTTHHHLHTVAPWRYICFLNIPFACVRVGGVGVFFDASIPFFYRFFYTEYLFHFLKLFTS